MKKNIPLLLILSGICMLAIAVALAITRPAEAQCGNNSSCKSCHEIQGQNPVSAKGAWHIDHASFDVCNACHGGNRDAADQATAHQGIVTSLEEMTTGCQSCHAADLEERFQKYADQLGVNGTESVQAAQVQSSLANQLDGAFGAAPALVQDATAVCETPVAETSEPNTTGNLILVVLLIAGVAGGGSLVLWNEKRMKRGKETK